MFLNIDVLKKLAVFTGKHLCWSVGLGPTVEYLLGLDIRIFIIEFLFTPK